MINQSGRAKRLTALTILSVMGLTAISHVAYGQEAWTLESAVQRAVQESPWIRATESQIEAQQGNLQQAGTLPNPEMGITGSNKMGKDDGRGGSDVTQYAVTQPLPIGKMMYQKGYARAELQAAQHESLYQRLVQENRAANYFHELQLAEAKLKLAKEKVGFANRYQKTDGGSDPLIRYVSELDKKRLALVRDTAVQELESAESEYEQAQQNFSEFLNLPKAQEYKTTSFQTMPNLQDVNELLVVQKANHAAISAARSKTDAANVGVSIAQAERLPDFGVTAFQEKDILDNRRQDFNGVMLTATVPLWDFKNGSVRKAKAEADSANYELQALERDLQAGLNASYTRLKYLNNQIATYQSKILAPANEVFDLTKKSFASDEVQILSLIDASDSYFDAREKYIELRYEQWTEAANLRLLSGQPLTINAIAIPASIQADAPKKQKTAKVKKQTKAPISLTENSVTAEAAEKEIAKAHNANIQNTQPQTTSVEGNKQ